MTLTTVLKKQKTHIQYHINIYPCRDETASLRVPPPGMTRVSAFCVQCPFYRDGMHWGGCLFVPSYVEDIIQAKSRDLTGRRAALRQAGLNAASRPLKPVCWNCIHIRFMPPRYCCAKGIIGSRTAGSMQRAQPCELFEWRVEIEILPFEE